VRDKFLLIVSSPDPGTAYFAGRRLIDSFQIPDNERRRTLNFKLSSYESAAVDIDSLFGKSDKNIDGETAVIIRCAGPQSARFLDSLFDKQEPDFYELRGKLKARGVYLICLIPSQELTRRKISLRRELHFDVWHIDRFGALLKGYSPDAYENVQERLFDQ